MRGPAGSSGNADAASGQLLSVISVLPRALRPDVRRGAIGRMSTGFPAPSRSVARAARPRVDRSEPTPRAFWRELRRGLEQQLVGAQLTISGAHSDRRAVESDASWGGGRSAAASRSPRAEQRGLPRDRGEVRDPALAVGRIVNLERPRHLPRFTARGVVARSACPAQPLPSGLAYFDFLCECDRVVVRQPRRQAAECLQ